MLYDNLKVGEIILTPFPFTDLSSKKTRPAVILSLSSSHKDDVIIGAISSKIGNSDIIITNEDLELGTLPVISYFKVGKIVTLHKSVIKNIIGELHQSKINTILTHTKNLF